MQMGVAMPGDDGIDWSQWPGGVEGFRGAFGNKAAEAIEQIRSGKPGLIDWSHWEGGEQAFRAMFGDKAQAIINSWFAAPQTGTAAALQPGSAGAVVVGARAGQEVAKQDMAGASQPGGSAQRPRQVALSSATPTQGAVDPNSRWPFGLWGKVRGK